VNCEVKGLNEGWEGRVDAFRATLACLRAAVGESLKLGVRSDRIGCWRAVLDPVVGDHDGGMMFGFTSSLWCEGLFLGLEDMMAARWVMEMDAIFPYHRESLLARRSISPW
jgi:hypothetical protein